MMICLAYFYDQKSNVKLYPAACGDWVFDWEILETMRLLRNGVQYRGQGITKEIWSDYKLRFDIYIRSLFSFVKNDVSD